MPGDSQALAVVTDAARPGVANLPNRTIDITEDADNPSVLVPTLRCEPVASGSAVSPGVDTSPMEDAGKFSCKWHCGPPLPKRDAYRLSAVAGMECNICFNTHHSIETYCRKAGTMPALEAMVSADPER